MMDYSQKAFLALVKSGLWEQDIHFAPIESIDFERVYQLAEEQSVLGLVAAGLEHIIDARVPKEDVLKIVGETLQIERRNTAMNTFVGVLVENMREAGIYTILVKGQGIAQCYERPLWRTCGDIDLYLDESNYKKAKEYLIPLASFVDKENLYNSHLAMTIIPWTVELHGTLKGGLWKRVDRLLDEIHDDVFSNICVRVWANGNSQVFLPRADEDVVFVFAHILQHFFRGGIGLRQICDWCRLLYTFKDKIDTGLLLSRLNKMDVLSEWKSFAALAVHFLGMPAEAMPFFDSSNKWKKKSSRLVLVILKTGNFGYAKDYSYKKNKTLAIRLAISFWRHTTESFEKACVFPMDSIKMWGKEMLIAGEEIVKGIVP